MPLDGNGNYTPPSPQFPAVPGEIIYADYFNAIILDIAEALSKALYDDGQRIWQAYQDAGGFGATGPFDFTTSPTMPTPATGDSSAKGATTAFVAGVAMATALPGQAGNAGKYVTTDGTDASWIIPVGQNLYNHYNLGGF